MSLTLLILLIKVYHRFACPKLPAIDPSKIQKHGLMLPSKLPGQNMETPTKPHTASPTTYSASTQTPFLPPARLKEYLCQNQCPQHNSLQWWTHQELVARANKKSIIILKLTSDRGSVHHDDASECSIRSSIMSHITFKMCHFILIIY